jgi:hypothetical protein
MEKHTFTGKIISIQPHIRVTRSYDEASHTNLDSNSALEVIL